MNEIWKNINDRYSVSDHGRIKSSYAGKEKILKPSLGADGRVRVSLMMRKNNAKSNLLHSFIADAFVPNPDKKLFVRHIDGNKQNNHASNLRWITRSEMMQEDIASGRRVFTDTQREALDLNRGKRKKKEVKQKVRMVRHIATQDLYDTITNACKALNLDKDIYLYRRAMERPLIDFEYFWVTL
mgnify:CR=1 FL=1|tara:strand:- start:139 stop:690 length:552 start_codon:yes stop_codon:yes gene_type:complete